MGVEIIAEEWKSSGFRHSTGLTEQICVVSAKQTALPLGFVPGIGTWPWDLWPHPYVPKLTKQTTDFGQFWSINTVIQFRYLILNHIHMERWESHLDKSLCRDAGWGCSLRFWSDTNSASSTSRCNKVRWLSETTCYSCFLKGRAWLSKQGGYPKVISVYIYICYTLYIYTYIYTYMIINVYWK